MNMAYSSQRSYGIIVNADSLRVYNSVFVIRAFETTLKIIRLNVKMLCDKEGCGKRNYVQRVINNLPTVFTIALQWENNETSCDIFSTVAALETEICISAICRYEGDSLYTKYRLVSMACSHGDQYNCIAYENSRWVRYFGSEKEVIGDWKSVVNIFVTHDNIRPEILFFESARQRGQVVSGQRDLGKSRKISPSQIMEMNPSEVQEVRKFEEIDQKLEPELSDSNTEESEEKLLNATSVSALDMILKSLWKISVFLSDFLRNYVQEAQHNLTDDESVLPQDILRIFLLDNLSLTTHPLEANGVSKLFLNILELLPRWNSHFKVNEVAKTNCVRCKTDRAYSGECSFGLIINANSLRVFKSALVIYTFATTLKIIRLNAKMLCEKEGCGKRNYVQHMINKLPSVFTIAFEWENNETGKEIFDTISVLATKIDIRKIYKYEGDSPYTKYRLVSMVCSHGDGYNCVAYENNGWVRHFRSEKEVIGDWDGVLNKFRELYIRPEILFFENTRQEGY
ncbi:PREDICTED: uncharacterized protein LOC104788568 isoform X2 [Camelina sativa]|uniref:Uncharacterized protein LOC104788568 isoform X2 n=2 Tax=Camelina sativa TaxID=90675 RepID=A0ABM0ZA79_CAMSA|nr:PREDICTED: uncharacterized protein LOC104788568 isoform X2 [Camelina sativa]